MWNQKKVVVSLTRQSWWHLKKQRMDPFQLWMQSKTSACHSKPGRLEKILDNCSRIITNDMNNGSPKFNDIIRSNYDAADLPSLYPIWLCFREWRLHEQAVSVFSEWLLNIGYKIFLAKTINTYLPSINSTVTDFHCMSKYIGKHGIC